MGEVQWGRTGLCFGDSRRTSSRTFAGAIGAELMGFVFLFCCWSTFPTVRKPAAWPWGEAGTEDMMSGLRRGRRARGGLWLGGWHPPPCPQHCLHLLPVVSKHPGFKVSVCPFSGGLSGRISSESYKWTPALLSVGDLSHSKTRSKVTMRVE